MLNLSLLLFLLSILVPANDGIVIHGNGELIPNGNSEILAANGTDLGVKGILTPEGKNRSVIEQTYVITNTSSVEAVTGLMVSVAGASCPDQGYEFTQSPPDSIPAGGSASFTVLLDDCSTLGVFRAVVTVEYTGFAPYIFSIAGILELDTGDPLDCRMCGEFLATNPRVCNSNGVCAEYGVCTCVQGVLPWCADSGPTCNGLLPTSSNVCSGRGICIGRDVCSCYPYFSGSECDVELSFPTGRKATFPNFSFNTHNIVLGPTLPEAGSVYRWTLRITGPGVVSRGFAIGVASVPLVDSKHEVGTQASEWAVTSAQGFLSHDNNSEIAFANQKFNLNDEIRVTLDRVNNTLSYELRKSFDDDFSAIGHVIQNVEPASGQELAIAVSATCFSTCSVTFLE